MKPNLRLVASNGIRVKRTISLPKCDYAKLFKPLARYGLGGVIMLFNMVRYSLFLLLMWLGMVVHVFKAVVVYFCFLGIAAGYVVLPHKDLHMLWYMAGSGFGVWVFAWLYDSLLFRLSPTPLSLGERWKN